MPELSCGVELMNRAAICPSHAPQRIASLPPGIARMSGLRQLDASRNALGKLPLELGALTALQLLDLSHNALVELPGSLACVRVWPHVAVTCVTWCD